MDTKTDPHLESPGEEHIPKGIVRAMRVYRSVKEWSLVLLFMSAGLAGVLIYPLGLCLLMNVDVTLSFPL